MLVCFNAREQTYNSNSRPENEVGIQSLGSEGLSLP